MTKKDYELIAKAIKDAETDDREASTLSDEKYFTYDKVARYIAIALKSENTRFDYPRFMESIKK